MKSNIRVIEKIGSKPGKTTIILAGIHGNEICGVKALDKLIPSLKIESGRVILIYANLEAIKQNKRFIEKNLNRCFVEKQPEDMINTIEGRTAKEIIPYLDSADILLDLHASNNPDTIPFVICDEKQIANASIFDANIISFNWDPFEPGSTDYYMNKKNKPAFCFECGYANDKNTIKIAKKAIINFLTFTKNISGNLRIKENQKFYRIKSIYKNKSYPFKKSRFFMDFEKVNQETIIGLEGDQSVWINKNDAVLFLKDSENLNEECFLIAEEINKETLINKQNMNKENEVNIK